MQASPPFSSLLGTKRILDKMIEVICNVFLVILLLVSVALVVVIMQKPEMWE